jgi:hypothetical protein
LSEITRFFNDATLASRGEFGARVSGLAARFVGTRAGLFFLGSFTAPFIVGLLRAGIQESSA